MPDPNTNGLALQWNIGLKLDLDFCFSSSWYKSHFHCVVQISDVNSRPRDFGKFIQYLYPLHTTVFIFKQVG